MLMKEIILVLHTPRSGYTSMFEILKKTCFENNYNGKVFSRYNCNDTEYFYNNLNDYHNSKDNRFINRIEKKIKNFKEGNIYISSSYPFILDYLLKIHPNKIKVIHLIRNKNNWIKSILNNSEAFPQSYGNYTQDKNAKQYLLTPCQCEKLSKTEWKKMPNEKKFIWYYNKTHSTIKKNKKNFIDYTKIYTEDLSKSSSLKKLAKFINKKWKPIKQPVHLNFSKFDFTNLSIDDKIIVTRILRFFDPLKFSKNILLGELFFSKKIIDGYINRKIYEHSNTSKKMLIKYKKALQKRIQKIDKLLSSK